MSLVIAALTSAFVTATARPQHVDAASPVAQPAMRRLPGPIDTVIADPTNLMYRYGPSEAERFDLQADSLLTSNITVTYDAGFIANPQAQAAFQAAVDIWRNVIVSPATIRVSASYRDLGSPNILGSAGASFVCTVPGGLANTYYAAALADKINGSAGSCSAGAPEINANFNSSFSNWDFGTSGVPVSGKYSFLTVVLHELGHGLGFFGSMTAIGGIGSFGGFTSGAPIIYDRFAVTGAGASLLDFVNPSAALGAQLVGNNTFFNGTNARANNSGISPKLETHHFTNDYGRSSDNGFAQGSSYSHVDDVLYTGTPNGLMTYALGTAEVYTDPGPIVRGMFLDEGWSLAGASSSAPSITSQPASPTVKKGLSAQFVVSANGSPAPTYQWQISTNGGSTWSSLTNGAPFSGVTTPTLTVNNTTLAMNGTRYRCIATNVVSSATSNAATLTVVVAYALTDFDGDRKADLGFYRPSNGTWNIERSTTNYATSFSTSWGVSTDIPVPGDYDGDGQADLAVYRPSTGTWFVLKSSGNYTTYFSMSWGLSSDLLVPGDYDGDGKADLAVYRPSNGTWYILQSSGNYATYTSNAWGLSTDIPVPGDYDGDGKTDLAVYRPSTGTWFVLQSSGNYTTYFSTPWGVSTDIPVPGDYDGDGKHDLAFYRPSNGNWYVLQSSSNYTTSTQSAWGTGTDIPLPKR